MADIVTSRTFVDGEKNITAAKLNDIVGSSVIQPAFVSAKPSASTVAPTDNLLILQAAGGAYAQAPFQTVIDSVNANLNTNAAIWSARLRSFQAVGNNSFEVDQVNIGNTVSSAAGKVIDRWVLQKSGTMVVSAGQNSVAAGINLPGTSFAISRSFFRVTLTTAEAALAAGDYLRILQVIEGPNWRELQNDVHSLQVLVRSSVAGLAFGAALQDPTAAHSLTNIFTIPSANVWTLLPMPNLVLWPAGTFVNTPGSAGYQILFTLACGSTFMSPANGTWQNGNFVGALGQSNFANSPVNSTFDIAYISHEPGALCSNPPMDCPFTQNYDDCLRYFDKSYNYAQSLGMPSSAAYHAGDVWMNAFNRAYSSLKFSKRMAKTPTCSLWAYDGTASSLSYLTSSNTPANSGYTSISNNEKGINYITMPSTASGNVAIIYHYTADTGW